MKTLLVQCKAMLSEGKTIEDVLAFLREEGCSRVDSIKAVMVLEDKTLSQAKETVHYSKTWEDTRESAEVFHDSLLDALEQKSKAH